MRPRRPCLHSPAFHLALLLAGIVIGVALDYKRPPGPVLLLSATLGMAIYFRTPLRVFASRLAPLFSFGVIAFALLLLAPVRPGQPALVLPLGGRLVSAQAFHFLAALWIKSTLIVLWVTVLGTPLSERDYLEGWLGLQMPARVAALLYLMQRGLWLAPRDLQQTWRAIEARGRPHGPRLLRVAAALSQTMLVRLGRRAETQAMALAARGFAGRLPLLPTRPLRLWLAVALIVLTGGLGWLARL